MAPSDASPKVRIAPAEPALESGKSLALEVAT